MTVVVEKARRIRMVSEANNAFATEIALGSFHDLKVREDAFKLVLEQPQETPMLQQQHPFGYPTKVFLPKKASCDFTVNLEGLKTRGGETPGAAGQLWNAVFGTVITARTATTVATTSTVTTVEVTSATGAVEGGVMVCLTGSGNALEARVIKTVSGTSITVKLDYSSVPSNGSVVYFASTYGMINTRGSSPLYAQMAIEGLGTDDRWLLKGGAPKSPPTFNMPVGQIPTVALSFDFADWDYANGTNTTMDLTAAEIADQDYALGGTSAVMDSELRIHATGTSTITDTLIHCSEVKIQPSIKFVAQKTPAGTNTIKKWIQVRQDGPPVTAEFVIPFEDQTWLDYRDAKTELALTMQIGSTSTYGGSLLECPRMIVDDVQREEVDGIAGQRIKLYGKLDNQTNTNSSDADKSPFRISFF